MLFHEGDGSNAGKIILFNKESHAAVKLPKSIEIKTGYCFV